MDKNYVQQYGELENNHWWFIIRRKIILQTLQNYIPPKEAGKLKILNVGAAAGGSSKWLAAFGEVISLENDPLFVHYLNGEQIPVINASVTAIPLADNSFDLVCAFDVIEHVIADQKAVDELIRVCKPGGTIFITVPAFQSLWGRHDVVNGHQRRYTKQQLQQLVNSHTATIQYTTYFNSILFLPVFLFRKIESIFNKNPKQGHSDFSYFKTNTFVNKVLQFVFGLELSLLRSTRLPFGVSLMMLCRKRAVLKDISQ
ncbi:MAG: class I SAM-dependent methyltransferase [Ferruginibacter sp.]|nr:class I SAM-dependent methyltransferase [Ferruginibacter sp.]